MKQISSEIFLRAFKHSNTFFIESSNLTGEPILSVSDNINTLLGYASSELCNEQTLFDDLIFDDDAAHYLLESQQGLLDEACEEIVHTAYRLVHKDGFTVWVKDAAQVIRENGRATSVIHLLSDVSSDMQVREKLEAEKEHLVGVLHNAGFGLWEWDTSDDNIYCDNGWSSLLGFPSPVKSLRISRFYALIHPDELASFKTELNDFINAKQAKFHKVVRVRHLSGKWRHHALHASLSINSLKQNLVLNMSHSDITEQRESELAALAALSTRNQFFARVSHEIRTPLHAILGMLAIMKQELSPQSSSDKIDKIIANSEHLSFLLNDILDLAKLNEAKLRISIEMVSVTEVFTQVVRLFIFKAQEKELSLYATLPDLQHDMVMTDKVRLTQVLCNLVSNAIKYTHSGSVHVYTKMQDSRLVLCVEDTGIGIKNTVDIFDAYKQEESGHALGSLSTGLGLEIVKKLSDLLGIDLNLVSSTSGSLFSLTLGKPMPNNTVSKTVKYEETSTTASLEGIRVLIVDDSDINREIVLSLLEGAGAACIEAIDGYEAVKEVEKDKGIDVVLMDKHMPNMNGIEATEQIRKHTNPDSQPIIIAVTADAFDIDSELWFDVGVDEIVTKPFDMDILLKTIKRCLRK